MLDLWVEAWRAVKPEIDFEARRGWLEQRLDTLARSGTRMFVALIDSCIAGFVTIDPDTGEVDQLATAVTSQRAGVGRGLLDHAKRSGPGTLVLSVNAFNASAIRLYEREGFQKVGEGVNTGSGLPLWHMRWRAGQQSIDRKGG